MKSIEICTNRFDNDKEIHLLNCTLKLTKKRLTPREQIAEQQRQSDIDSQMDDNDSSPDDGVVYLNLSIIV